MRSGCDGPISPPVPPTSTCARRSPARHPPVPAHTACAHRHATRSSSRACHERSLPSCETRRVDRPSESEDLSELSAYESRAWDAIQKWKQASARRSVVPAAIRDNARGISGKAVDRLKTIPGTSQVTEAIDKALSGGYEALTDLVAKSIQTERILKAVRDTGVSVNDLSDLRTLDLEILDDVCPSLNTSYAASSATTGAVSGFVAGGGTAGIIGTAGVAAAPGGLAVGSAIVGDVMATIALAARVVAHYAGYYGYDARDEDEKAVLLAVVGVSLAAEGAAKQAAMVQVRQVAMMVARRATWKELSDETIVKLIQGLFAKLSVNLTKRKLAQALPVAGIAIGALFNYHFMRRVGTAASYAYRERFLVDKYDLDRGLPTPDLDDVIDVEGFEED